MKKPFAWPRKDILYNDPDETEGRRIYRGRANAEARMSLGLGRPVKLKKDVA
jgi:hypothetical protein